MASHEVPGQGEEPRASRWPSWVYRSGHEPDPRFTLANERTFLAWIRTALGLVAAGIAVKALLDGRPAQLGATVLIVLGALTPSYAFLRWAVSERALRHARPLPAMASGVALAIGLTAAGMALLVALLA